MVAAPEARDRRLFLATFAALWICAVVPLWAPRFLPLLDLPIHLDAIAIWHRYHDSSWGYTKFYDLNLIPLPYWGYFFPVHLLSYLFPIEIANKIYLSVYAALLPFSVAALAERMGRNRWLALFSFPLVFNMNFSYGFITFCMGLVVLNFAIVVLDRFLETATPRRGIVLALLSLGLYTTHVLPWMFFGVASIALACAHGWHPRRILVALALELPSLLLAIIGFRAAANGTTAVQPGTLAVEAHGEPLLARLQLAPLRLITGWGNDTAYWMLLILSLAWLLLLMTAQKDEESAAPARHGHAYRLEILVLLAVLAYLTLPMHLIKPVDLWLIGGRFMTIIALFAALLPTGKIIGWRRWILAPVIVIAIAYPISMAVHWVHYDQRAAGFRRLMRNVPRGSSTLVLVLNEPGDPDADKPATPYLEYHAYAQFLSGGYDPWALATGFPFTLKKETALPAPAWRHFNDFNFEAQGTHYDYIMTRGETQPHGVFGPDDAYRAPLVGSDGEFRLYRVRAVRP
jgi:hypothetical protein